MRAVPRILFPSLRHLVISLIFSSGKQHPKRAVPFLSEKVLLHFMHLNKFCVDLLPYFRMNTILLAPDWVWFSQSPYGQRSVLALVFICFRCSSCAGFPFHIVTLLKLPLQESLIHQLILIIIVHEGKILLLDYSFVGSTHTSTAGIRTLQE